MTDSSIGPSFGSSMRVRYMVRLGVTDWFASHRGFHLQVFKSLENVIIIGIINTNEHVPRMYTWQ